MSAQRLVALSFLVVVAAACAPRTGTQAPRPIAPENGPKGSLHVRYSGGLFYRTVDASFRVDENAFVIVGHLGGDGVIRVLYPASPFQAFRPVRAKQSIAVRSFMAGFDGAPSLLSQGRSPFRNLSAMHDSYDGRGHGFVFMIATRSLMYIDAISGAYEWDDLDVVDYLLTSDPRLAIREFADRLTGDDSYTLRFANSFSTQSFTSYASSAWDCSLLSSFGYGHLVNFWGSWGLGGLSFLGYGGSPYSGLSGCGQNRYAYYSPRYAYYGYPRQAAIGPRIPTATPGQPQPPPMGPITPVLTRPTQRAFGEASRGVFVGRSAFDRRPATVNSGLERRGSSSPRDEGIRNRPSGMQADRPSTRSVDRPRASTTRGDSPRTDSPRSNSPRTTGGERPAPTTRSDSPRSSGGARTSPAPQAAPAPRSNPPSTTATKTTSEVKPQQ